MSHTIEMHGAPLGRVVHLELHTPDLPEARCFYRRLCGWRDEEIHTPAGSYHAFELGSSIGGGMVECPTTRSLWLPYVEVRDVAEMTERAESLGARVMLAAREGPAGWRSVIATRAGGELAFWQPKR